VRYRLMTTDAICDREMLIARHLHHPEQTRQHAA
jgi:hypothetical protein